MDKIGIGMGMRHLAEVTLGTEILYSFVIIACCLIIYFGTKELYELSSHKGIKYFRLSFLYFAIAYFFRSFLKFVLTTISKTDVFAFPTRSLGMVSLPLFIYFSSMSVMYLLYSTLYKRIKLKINLDILLNFIAIGLAIISLVIRNPIFNFYLHLLFFIIIITSVIIAKISEKKKHNHLYVVYLMLLFFWGLNILGMIIPTFFQTIQMLIYLASISIFLIMLYKVIKNTGGH